MFEHVILLKPPTFKRIILRHVRNNKNYLEKLFTRIHKILINCYQDAIKFLFRKKIDVTSIAVQREYSCVHVQCGIVVQMHILTKLNSSVLDEADAATNDQTAV